MADDNRQWILRRRPTGALTEEVFELETSPIPIPGAGEVLIRVLELSLDPANRVWIVGPSYRAAVEVGAVMDGFAIGKVIRSEDPAIAEGAYVTGDLGWQDYAVRAAADLEVVPRETKRPLSHYLGVLGITGLTAYFGLLDVGRAKPRETVLISGAAGATGSVVGQIAKMWGCRVVGIAGTKAKCDWLVDDLKFDAAINYREQDLPKAIRETCPDRVDLYFDNVGGKTLEAALFAMRDRGRVVCCGAISGYDLSKPQPSPFGIPGLLIGRRLKMQGFIVMDYAHRFRDGRQALAGWIDSGHVQVKEDRVDGLEQAPRGLMGLLAGENIGKRYVHVADEG
ncbi:MAG: NADP-dependent oxidoreductase [Myxococcota bacterium]